MTTDWREAAPCPNCATPVSTEQPIKAWIRGHDDLDSRRACLCVGDSDLWVHRYGTRRTRLPGVDRDVQYLMLVEIKTHGRGLDSAQRDLLLLVNELLRTVPWREQRVVGRFVAGHRQNVRKVHAFIAGRTVQVHCYGVHKLRLSGTTPDDSEWITWDDKPIDAAQLSGVLRFDLSPDSLKPLEHRAHKRTMRAPSLFDDEQEGIA
ncbi:hypothetical protein OHR68_09830 [Spirillospora sp. NBC_00431]